MRVTIYDRKPGPGIGQWFLMMSWVIGAWLHRIFRATDVVKGFDSWNDAMEWLKACPKPITSLQVWCHGSPGTTWMSGKGVGPTFWLKLKGFLPPDCIVWFRACSVFQGEAGHVFSKLLADGLGCTVAGHTRTIGVFQGGLYTRKPHTEPAWPVTEGELPGKLAEYGLKWGNRTVFCLVAKVPKGW